MDRADLLAALGLLLALPPASAGQGVVEGVVLEAGSPVLDAVVYLESEGPTPDTAAEPPSPTIDQSRLQFLPSVLVVRPGTEVAFLNSDPILHNVFSPGWSGERFDLGTYPFGTARTHVFREVGPHVILCKVHPEMAAYVLVVDTPFHAVTADDGRFVVGPVPAGTYRLSVWARGQPSFSQEVTVPPEGRAGLRVDLAQTSGLPPAMSR